MILCGFDSRNRLVRILPFGLWLLVTNGLNAQQQIEHAPTGWFLAGNNPTNYRTGVDRADIHQGLPSAYLVSLAKGNGFGTLMQSISAANYVGKRVRLRGWVNSQDLDAWAGLWMRVDKGRETVALDNMQDRGIKGATPWSTYDVVLDVPEDATSISFGILLTGTGEVWMNDLSLEVDIHTPMTGTNHGKTLPQRPVNLGLDE